MIHRRALLLLPCLLLLAPPGQAAQIDIPLRTWVAVPSPALGEGPCPGGGCKHLRLAMNPLNRRIYVDGGDYDEGDGNFESGRNEVWSYDIETNTWALESPYCVPAGQVQPSHPDETGWAFDSRRNLFWMLPGYMGQTIVCSGELRNKNMTFDPATRLWRVQSDPTDPSYSVLQFAQYDPVTDKLLRFGHGGSAFVSVYDPATNTESRVNLTVRNATTSSTPVFDKEYSALDLQGRRIFLMDPLLARIYRYDMDAQTLTELATAPSGTVQDQSMIFWDSANQVVLFPQVLPVTGTIQPATVFHVFHPDTNTWELNLPIVQPQGITVMGRNGIYDPYQNVLLITGANASNIVPYIFLYRYGNGSGGAPADSIPPSPPESLRTR